MNGEDPLVDQALERVWAFHEFKVVDGRLKVLQVGDREELDRWIDAYHTVQRVACLTLKNDYTRSRLNKVIARVRIRAMTGGRFVYPVVT